MSVALIGFLSGSGVCALDVPENRRAFGVSPTRACWSSMYVGKRGPSRNFTDTSSAPILRSSKTTSLGPTLTLILPPKSFLGHPGDPDTLDGSFVQRSDVNFALDAMGRASYFMTDFWTSMFWTSKRILVTLDVMARTNMLVLLLEETPQLCFRLMMYSRERSFLSYLSGSSDLI